MCRSLHRHPPRARLTETTRLSNAANRDRQCTPVYEEPLKFGRGSGGAVAAGEMTVDQIVGIPTLFEPRVGLHCTQNRVYP
jgi:hypothetical protein